MPKVAPDDEALILANHTIKTLAAALDTTDKALRGQKHDGPILHYRNSGLIQRHMMGVDGIPSFQDAFAEMKARAESAEAALAACMAGKVPEGSVVLPKQAIEALYMRLWARHEHLDDGPPDFEPVRQPWTPDDDAALKAVAKYLFAAPESPR